MDFDPKFTEVTDDDEVRTRGEVKQIIDDYVRDNLKLKVFVNRHGVNTCDIAVELSLKDFILATERIRVREGAIDDFK